MRIFDATKTYTIENPDLSLGYLVDDTIIVKSHPYIPPTKEIGHYETVRTYSNGGKDVRWIVDVNGKEEQLPYNDVEEIKVFIYYTEEELAERKIRELKNKLFNTDYQAIKFAEGVITELEYEPTKIQRNAWRKEINELQEKFGLYY